ncbi:hypothetical protein SGPA1_10588 [Streptomyces misionensis JCM 4497]
MRHAHRHLERELDHRPPPAPAGLAGEQRHRRALPPGGQGRRGAVPRRAAAGAGLRERGARHRPVERRGGALPRGPGGRAQGTARRPRVRRRDRAPRRLRHLRPGPRLVGVRAQRPRGRPPALRLQAPVVRGPARGRARRRAGRPPLRGPRRLQRGADRRRRVRHRRLRGRHPCHPRRARRPRLPARGRSERRRPAPAQVRPALHLLGLPPALLPEEPRHAHRPGVRQRALRQGRQGRLRGPRGAQGQGRVRSRARGGRPRPLMPRWVHEPSVPGPPAQEARHRGAPRRPRVGRRAAVRVRAAARPGGPGGGAPGRHPGLPGGPGPDGPALARRRRDAALAGQRRGAVPGHGAGPHRARRRLADPRRRRARPVPRLRPRGGGGGGRAAVGRDRSARTLPALRRDRRELSLPQQGLKYG